MAEKPSDIDELTLPNLPHTPDQLFWIAMAQAKCAKYSWQWLERRVPWARHPIYSFRVNSMASNSRSFAEDFGCPQGSRMNPDDKCMVWGFHE